MSVQSKGAVVSGTVQLRIPETANGSPSGSPSLSSTPSTAETPVVVSDVCGVVPAVMSTRSSVLPSTSNVSLTTIGGSFTGSTVMVNICGADVFTPPFAVPPLSCSTSVMVAVPNAFGALV